MVLQLVAKVTIFVKAKKTGQNIIDLSNNYSKKKKRIYKK